MTVLPHIGGTTSAKSETSRMHQYHQGRRRFDHDEAYRLYLYGTDMAALARKYGVHRSSIEQAIRNVRAGVARSPQQPPPVSCTPSSRTSGVAGAATAGGVEAGGLRGAPAGDPLPPARDEKEKDSLVEVGAPIVRRQHDDQGDLIYVVSLPAAHYTTHARSLVDELLQPFDPGTVRWVNEEADQP